MTTPELDDQVEMRIETEQPGTDRLMIHVSPMFAHEVAVAFEEAGGHVTRDIIELSVPEVANALLEVAGPIVASGTAIATILKQWWHRNDGKKATVTFNGESIAVAGMSIDEIARIVDAAHQRWDDKWRDQFPDRFSGDES